MRILAAILTFIGLGLFVLVVAVIQAIVCLSADRSRIESNKGKTEGDE